MKTKPRTILHINITDNDGKVVADVDAASTADGLAYFLASRGIEPRATEEVVKAAAETRSDTEPIVFTQRTWDGLFVNEYAAAVH